jgi:hypothetical protein
VKRKEDKNAYNQEKNNEKFWGKKNTKEQKEHACQ